MDPHRDAFGRLLVSPDGLPLRERVYCVRRLVGALQASHDIDVQWLGVKMGVWLHGGAPTLEAALGIPPGLPAALMRRAEVARLLLRLSVLVGGDECASRILRGVEQVPPAAVELVADLRARGAPASRRAFVRARTATRKAP